MNEHDIAVLRHLRQEIDFIKRNINLLHPATQRDVLRHLKRVIDELESGLPKEGKA